MSIFFTCSVAAEKLQISMLKCNFSAATEHTFFGRVPHTLKALCSSLIRDVKLTSPYLYSIDPVAAGSLWGLGFPSNEGTPEDKSGVVRCYLRLRYFIKRLRLRVCESVSEFLRPAYGLTDSRNSILIGVPITPSDLRK